MRRFSWVVADNNVHFQAHDLPNPQGFRLRSDILSPLSLDPLVYAPHSNRHICYVGLPLLPYIDMCGGAISFVTSWLLSFCHLHQLIQYEFGIPDVCTCCLYRPHVCAYWCWLARAVGDPKDRLGHIVTIRCVLSATPREREYDESSLRNEGRDVGSQLRPEVALPPPLL